MLGGILRLLAMREAVRRFSGYLRKAAAKYLVLSAAGMFFLAAAVFAILAVFWALISSTRSPAISAAIMTGALGLIGVLTTLTAYGIGRKAGSVTQALPVSSHLPSLDDIGRQIGHAARVYGPLRVTAAAAAGGLITGFLASRFRPGNGAERHPGSNSRGRRRTCARRSRGRA